MSEEPERQTVAVRKSSLHRISHGNMWLINLANHERFQLARFVLLFSQNK